MHTINWLKDKKNIDSKQKQSSTMKNLRIIKKTNQLYKSVQSHSRQIISNIFSSVTSNNDQLQLQLKAKDWSQHYKNPILKPQALLHEKKQQKPLTNLLILLKHLSKGFYIETCSFIFLDKDTIYLAEKDQTLRIQKAKKQKAKLKYWLSHLYFNRIKGKLSEQLLEDFKVSGELIHHNEQKQYMPSCVMGRSQPTPIVRGLKVTRSSIYRSHGQQQQPFCIVHYHNNNHQLLTLSQALSFIDYPFNIAQVSYFQILPKLKDASNSIITYHSKKIQKIEQKIILDKLKRIFTKQDHWEMLKEDLQDQKNNLMKSQQYQLYAELIMLEMIAFIEAKNYVQIKEIKIEWVVNQQNQIVLSNAEIYRLVEALKSPQNNEGLVTLYEKCQFNRLKTNPINESDYRYSPFKKMKSQQKYLNKSQPKLPLLFWQKKPAKQDNAIKKKANSCVLRTTHKIRSPF